MIFEIRGAKARIEDPEESLRRVAAWSTERGVEVLVAEARAVFGRDHLVSAAHHAIRAQAQGSMTSRSLAMETLVYLSGRRQVADAIAVAGIRPGTEAVGIVVFGDTLASECITAMGWTADPRVLEAATKNPSRLGIHAEELATVPSDRRPDLALERVALLDLEK